MNVVYKLIFESRIERNEMPYYYIGSKANIDIVDGMMIDKQGKFYLGSSKYPNYKTITQNEDIRVEILYEGKDILVKERDYHIKYDVVTNPEYFNLGIATISPFNTTGYGSYKHVVTGKVVKLLKDHPDVVSGVYVGVTKGNKLSESERLKRSTSSKRHFLGKHHTDETKAKLRESKLGTKASEKTKQKMSEARKGVPKSKEHREKIGVKGLVMLHHPDGRVVRVKREEVGQHKAKGFMNVNQLKALRGEMTKSKCPHCGKVGNVNNMKRWHFDNCKKRGQHETADSFN